MISLPNGCYCTELKVFPSNWKKVSASTRKDWYIWYRFQDPAILDNKGQVKSKLVVVKGMNEFKLLADRQSATQELLEMEMSRLKIDGFNPITKTYKVDLEVQQILSPSTLFIAALHSAKEGLKTEVTKPTYLNIKSCLKYVEIAMQKLQWKDLRLADVTRRHIKVILDTCNLSEVSFNHYRTYLMMMVKKMDFYDNNPVSGVEKKAEPQVIRPVMVKSLREKVESHYSETDPVFLRFLHLFFHSGGREIEMLRLKKEDVDLHNRRFIVTIKKGGKLRQVYRPIKDAAYAEWEQIYNEARPSEFLFGIDFYPSEKPCKRDYLTRKWHREVKADKKAGGLGIKVDLYTLKHANLDETAELLSIQDASKMAGHSTPIITMEHYAKGEKERSNERLRKVNNPFA